MAGLYLHEILLVAALVFAARRGCAVSAREPMREEHYVIDGYSRQLQDRNRVQFGDFPFLVFIERRPDIHVCEGSIVSKYWVVTSAQMISTVPISIRHGIRVRAGSLERARGGVLHQTTKVITHPFFKQPSMFENDIALVKVRHAFTHDNYVSAIRMATLADNLPPGTSVHVCGWGKGRRGEVGERLLKTTLQIVSNQKCEASGGIRRLKELLGPHVHITDTMICAATYNKDTAMGDSGGPLFYVHQEKPLLVGIISWGEGRGDLDSPGVYTSIAKYRKWMFMEMATSSLVHSVLPGANDTVETLP